MSARHTRSKGKEVVTPSPPAPPSRTAKRSKARSRAAPSSASSFTLEDEEDESLLVSLLPMECLVEVLRYLEVHELLDVAWTCKRFHLAAQDHALWDRTHFSVADWQSVLQRHFAEDPAKKPNKDHTGTWSRCICKLNQVRRRSCSQALTRRMAQHHFICEPHPPSCLCSHSRPHDHTTTRTTRREHTTTHRRASTPARQHAKVLLRSCLPVVTSSCPFQPRRPFVRLTRFFAPPPRSPFSLVRATAVRSSPCTAGAAHVP